MISGFTIGFTLVRKLLAELRWRSHLVWLTIQARILQNWRSGVIRKIVCDFCAEAAVLAFIFPFLDSVIENMRNAKSGVAITLIPVQGVLGWSLSFVALALFGAFILGNKE